MREKIDKRIPRYTSLIMPTFLALKELGGSGKNNEILDQIIKDLQISDEAVDIQHKGRTDKSELSYQADWAKTYLSRYGVIENSATTSSSGIWTLIPRSAIRTTLPTSVRASPLSMFPASRRTV